jgi:Skp family chaperone for outer membrane proteins
VKKHHIAIIVLTAASFSACAPSSPVGLVDVQRIVANWPEYQTDQSQLLADEQSIAGSKQTSSAKQAAALALQRKYAKITDQLTQQIRDAATKIAQDRQLKLVVTREGVGYGGVDITPDVEKSLNITEKASPAPSGS